MTTITTSNKCYGFSMFTNYNCNLREASENSHHKVTSVFFLHCSWNVESNYYQTFDVFITEGSYWSQQNCFNIQKSVQSEDRNKCVAAERLRAHWWWVAAYSLAVKTANLRLRDASLWQQQWCCTSVGGRRTTKNSLVEAGQVLHHLGYERERAGRALGGVLLHQVEQGGGHDGRAHEAKEQGGADEAVGEILSSTLSTSGSPRGKDFFQLPGKYAETGAGLYYPPSRRSARKKIK